VNARRIALFITTLTLVAFATPVASASADAPSLPRLRHQLRQTRQHLRDARETLSSARVSLTQVQALAAAAGEAPIDPEDPELAALAGAIDPVLGTRLLADGVIAADEIDQRQQRVDKWRGIVHRIRRAEDALEDRIALRVRIADWNRRGVWRPLVEIAARRYRVDPDGLYRLMMYESGGRRCAGSTFKGLFQYYPGTWAAGWNPWRSESIYSGWAQIQATAYAVGRGMGPANWASTYYRAF
jgi:hypothetical protein